MNRTTLLASHPGGSQAPATSIRSYGSCGPTSTPQKEQLCAYKGVGGWVRRWWRALLAEVVSTTLLMWLGCATLVPVSEPVILTHSALAFGFLVVANICAFGETSGAHMNPAVTLAAVLYGQLEVVPAIGYVLAQLLGASLGFAGLVATSPADKIASPTGVTLPGPGVSPLAAVAIEAVITGMLVLTVCGVWAAHNSTHPDVSAPLKVGLVVAALIYAEVYWVGPLIGAALAALLHRWVLTPRPKLTADDEPFEAEMPLNHKA